MELKTLVLTFLSISAIMHKLQIETINNTSLGDSEEKENCQMLTATTWCLPNLKEDELLKLHNAIVDAICSVPSANVKSEKVMLNLLPPDKMAYGLGDEIKTEIVDVPTSMNVRHRRQLATAVGEAVKKMFPNANVHCVVRKPNPLDGTWSSER